MHYASRVGIILVFVGSLLGQSTVVTRATGTFDIRSELSGKSWKRMTVHRFRASSLGAYFLVSDGPVCRQAVILHTDTTGRSVHLLVLPAAMEALDFDIDDHGTVYALAGEATPAGYVTSLLQYDSTGTLQSTLPTARFANRVCVVQGKAVAMLPDQANAALEIHVPDGSVLAPVSLGRGHTNAAMVSLPGNRIATIERPEYNVQIFDLGSQLGTSFVAGGPQPASAVPLPQRAPTLGRAAFSGLAASPTGDLLLLKGNYRLSDGAPVFRYTGQGKLVEFIRCILPPFADHVGPNNPAGYMSAGLIGVSESLFMLVDLDGKVAVYRL